MDTDNPSDKWVALSELWYEVSSSLVSSIHIYRTTLEYDVPHPDVYFRPVVTPSKQTGPQSDFIIGISSQKWTSVKRKQICLVPGMFAVKEIGVSSLIKHLQSDIANLIIVGRNLLILSLKPIHSLKQ